LVAALLSPSSRRSWAATPPLALLIALGGGSAAFAESVPPAKPRPSLASAHAAGLAARVAAAPSARVSPAVDLAAIQRYSEPLADGQPGPTALDGDTPQLSDPAPGLGRQLAQLEERDALLESRSFAASTTLSGQMSAVLGASRYSGSSLAGAGAANQESGGFSFNNELELVLNTSFQGNDLLFLTLRVGNFGNTPFGGFGVSGDLSSLEMAFEKRCQYGDCDEVLALDRLGYRWPLGAGFTALLGARVGQEDTLPLWPSWYPSTGVLNVFTANGAPAAWNLSEGIGGGIWWEQHGFSIAASYIAASDQSGAVIGTAESAASGSVQVGFSSPSFKLAAIWTRPQLGVGSAGATVFSAGQLEGTSSEAFGLAGGWQPTRAGWLPSLSLGWGYNRSSLQPPQVPGRLRESQSWQLALQWQDALAKGNGLGLAVGQPVFATALSGGRQPDDGGVILEGWYRLQLSDAISVAPALFWLSRPLGMDTPSGGRLGQLGALLRTDIAF
jgi:hypothetical protein